MPQLVPADQHDLLPALSFLLRSRALASALAQPSGSDHGRIAARLFAEVETQYSRDICHRLQGVIQGLVGMAEPPSTHPAWKPAPAAQTSASQPVVTTVVSSNNNGAWGCVIALFCFMVGIVGSGLLVLLWQQQSRQHANSSTPPTALPNPPTPPPTPPSRESLKTPQPTPLSTDAVNAAVTSVQELYGALSAKDYATASSHYGPMAADQFEPTFFDQFERVTVADLRQTSSTGSMINFEGVVTFVYHNGDVQTESRSFTVDTRSNPALITSSEFGGVLQPR